MITKLKDEKQLLKQFAEKPTRYPTATIIGKFHPVRRRKQIEFAKQGEEELRAEIENADKLEEQGRLKLTCFFANLRGDLAPLGVLASYVDDKGGCLLWWTPEEDK